MPIKSIIMESPRLQQLKTFLQNSPDDAFILFAIAKEYEKLGDREQSLSYYTQLTEKQPDYVGTYYHLGKLQEQLGQPATAFQTYKKGIAIAKSQNDQHAASELAGAKLMLGDDEDFE